MIGYVNSFKSKRTMSFKISDSKLLKKYNQLWKKVKNLLNIKFGNEFVYGDIDKYIKTKMNMYDGNVNTNFQDKEMSKENILMKMLVISNAGFC